MQLAISEYFRLGAILPDLRRHVNFMALVDIVSETAIIAVSVTMRR